MLHSRKFSWIWRRWGEVVVSVSGRVRISIFCMVLFLEQLGCEALQYEVYDPGQVTYHKSMAIMLMLLWAFSDYDWDKIAPYCFFPFCDKTSNKSNLGGACLFYIIVWGYRLSWQRKLEALGYNVSRVRNLREKNVGTQLDFFFIPLCVLPIFSEGLPTSLLFCKCPNKHAQKCISLVTLNSIKLIIKNNYYTL